MTEIMINILLYMLGALGIGFLFGYLISRSFSRENYEKKLKEIGYLMRKKNSENIVLKDQISTLKAEYKNASLKRKEFTDIEISNIQPLS